ncbi:plasmid mobilization relaxosome protein MobC [Mucilaginibacter rubeus]|uniref:Plasmid mobilization relaxosome protein MobC n=1 Tax=Mucilaginibacter rubeus TaxID=2027860 RepID=A0AAE6MKZ1_9SPHI|nr:MULTISPECIES: plasmid mobilization relaxosome protein MobC [Mucilaginibacter]QEM07220.1 plasmid mobilization relaxosome protein MobC [Mucilaginibacter rubeus]QEM19675.1 plasmid mobilization relaxosome protein MobC [Mucilaginibacter gossypii]QTE43627.1 plasmid mobilization relaxosome protein MobC [Mucilaginibacter rubeus]QTE50227.1 plasmid mobilization relaxosome protein MobC [Mucilaginibacter rubeus]QTE55315.1 plasmid mobilization relaxosome protein MobC [Mucilaginibacter rubeus]
MGDQKKSNGRPKLEDGKRNKIVNVRFTEAEFKSVTELEKELNITKTELIRMRVLENAEKVVLNSRELLGYLDHIGAEMGRVGNNINQLARHANLLKLQKAMHPGIILKFEELFEEYLHIQQQLEIALRKIIRLMGK